LPVGFISSRTVIISQVAGRLDWKRFTENPKATPIGESRLRIITKAFTRRPIASIKKELYVERPAH
jgi:hypothetical protein